jgi:hypothetical protein
MQHIHFISKMCLVFDTRQCLTTDTTLTYGYIQSLPFYQIITGVLLEIELVKIELVRD